MPRGRPLAELAVTAEEPATLVRLDPPAATAAALAVRAHIVLGPPRAVDKDVAATLRIARRRSASDDNSFWRGRLDGLLDEPDRARRGR